MIDANDKKYVLLKPIQTKTGQKANYCKKNSNHLCLAWKTSSANKQQNILFRYVKEILRKIKFRTNLAYVFIVVVIKDFFLWFLSIILKAKI